MGPSAEEMVRAILDNFETMVVPALSERQALSAAAGISTLLRHLAARIEAEPPALHEDNADKRDLCLSLNRALEAHPATATEPALARLAESLEATARRQYRPPAVFPTVASLTEESTALKTAIDAAIGTLHQHRAVLGLAFSDFTSAIRAQLARQCEREARCFSPNAGPLF